MESRRHQILSTSSKLFAEKGFPGSSMRNISAQMGVEAASLYSHISSKEELLQEIIFPLGEELLKQLDEVNDIYFNGEEKLRVAIKNHVEVLCRNMDAFQVFIQDWKYLTEPHLSQFKKMRDRYESGFRQIIQTGMDENIFENLDKKFVVLTLLSSVNWVAQWYNPEGPLTPEKIAENISDILIYGIKKKSHF